MLPVRKIYVNDQIVPTLQKIAVNPKHSSLSHSTLDIIAGPMIGAILAPVNTSIIGVGNSLAKVRSL